MAKPIETVSTAFGKDMINSDVKKILNMIARPKSQYFWAISRRFALRVYCAILVKIMGRVSKDMAMVGSITSVSNAIAAAGKPIPRKPFTIPERKNTPKTANVIAMSWEGKSDVVMNSFKAVLFYPCFAPTRLDARALYTPAPSVIAPAIIRIRHIGRDR